MKGDSIHTVGQTMFTVDEARTLLTTAGVFFGADEDEDGNCQAWSQTLNQNDTWAWASADGEYVSDEELPRVAELFFNYGWCGILYWVSEKRGGMRSEFHDNNRFLEFVQQEESIREEIPEATKRAYSKRSYTITGKHA